MTYDLRWLQVPNETADGEVAGRHDELPENGYKRDYFSVNHSGMYDLICIMSDLDMVHVARAPIPPDPADFHLTPPVPDLTRSDDPKVQAYWEAMRAWCATESDEFGIPLFKLASNDDWIITPREIGEALARLHDRPMPEFDLWTTWIAFLRGAQRHGELRCGRWQGGFRYTYAHQ